MEGGGRVELFEESVDIIVFAHRVFMNSAWRCIKFRRLKVERREVSSQYMTYFLHSNCVLYVYWNQHIHRLWKCPDLDPPKPSNKWLPLLSPR